MLKFCIDLADILLVGSPGSALLISQMLIADNRGEFLVYLDMSPSRVPVLLARYRKDAKICSSCVNLDV